MRYIVKKDFTLPGPHDNPPGTGLEIKANATEPAELDMLNQEQVEHYIAEGFIEVFNE